MANVPVLGKIRFSIRLSRSAIESRSGLTNCSVNGMACPATRRPTG